jgi:hypothetical protein
MQIVSPCSLIPWVCHRGLHLLIHQFERRRIVDWPSAVAMERRVVRWVTDLCGDDENAGANFISGGMMANFDTRNRVP